MQDVCGFAHSYPLHGLGIELLRSLDVPHVRAPVHQPAASLYQTFYQCSVHGEERCPLLGTAATAVLQADGLVHQTAR